MVVRYCKWLCRYLGVNYPKTRILEKLKWLHANIVEKFITL